MKYFSRINILVTYLIYLILINCLISTVFCETKSGNDVIELSLKDAINLAYKNNREILIQEQEIKRGEIFLHAAMGEFLPKLNLRYNYIYNNAVPDLLKPGAKLAEKDPGVFFGYIHENKLGASLDQTVFSSGRNLSNLKQARINLKIQKEILRAKRLNVEFEIIKIYYGLLLAAKTEKIAYDLKEQAQTHYNDIKKKYAQGIASRYDMLQSKVQVSKVSPQVVKAKNTKELIESELKKAIGFEMSKKIVLKEDLIYTHIDFNEPVCLNMAITNRPELIIKTLTVDFNKQGIYFARSFGMPKIDANMNYFYRSDDPEDLINPEHNLWSAGITISIPFFNSYSIKSKTDDAKVKYNQSVIEKSDLVKQIELEVRRACVDLQNAETIIISQKDSVEEAKEALQISMNNYENGVGTNLDILDAQTSLSQIEQNLYIAIYDYNIAKAYLDKTRGISSDNVKN